jgi:YHS domain-containing protein
VKSKLLQVLIGLFLLLQVPIELHAQQQVGGRIVIAMKGYCPISSNEKQTLTSGFPEFAYRYRGEIFLFENRQCLDKFKKLNSREKDAVVPMLWGVCPVSAEKGATQKMGNPKFSVKVENRLYWCSSEEARSNFKDKTWKYEPAFGGYCTYCYVANAKLGTERREVKGSWYSHHHASDGRLYLFPNPETLEIFMNELDKTRYLGIDLIEVDKVEPEKQVDKSFFHTYNRRTYFFSSEANREKFISDPTVFLEQDK